MRSYTHGVCARRQRVSITFFDSEKLSQCFSCAHDGGLNLGSWDLESDALTHCATPCHPDCGLRVPLCSFPFRLCLHQHAVLHTHARSGVHVNNGTGVREGGRRGGAEGGREGGLHDTEFPTFLDSIHSFSSPPALFAFVTRFCLLTTQIRPASLQYRRRK